jgi:hypothetical protein
MVLHNVKKHDPGARRYDHEGKGIESSQVKRLPLVATLEGAGENNPGSNHPYVSHTGDASFHEMLRTCVTVSRPEKCAFGSWWIKYFDNVPHVMG